jgi:ankyrin repeat protein
VLTLVVLNEREMQTKMIFTGYFMTDAYDDLTKACYIGDIERVRHLIERGVENIQPSREAKHEDEHMARFLSEGKVLEFALGLSSERGHADIVRLLLEAGAEEIHVAISLAAEHEQVDVMRVLFEKGASTEGLLLDAAEYGRIEVVRFLLSVYEDAEVDRWSEIFGDFMNHTSDELNESLLIAVLSGYTDIARLLIGAGADPTEVSSSFQVDQTALETLQRAKMLI